MQHAQRQVGRAQEERRGWIGTEPDPNAGRGKKIALRFPIISQSRLRPVAQRILVARDDSACPVRGVFRPAEGAGLGATDRLHQGERDELRGDSEQQYQEGQNGGRLHCAKNTRGSLASA